MATAVVLAGLPGKMYWPIYRLLNERFPTGYVFRGIPGKSLGVGRALYDDGQIAKLMQQAADAVWGNSRRSNAFCRNPQRPCALRDGKKACGKTADQSCSLAKPDRLLVLANAGDGLGRLLNHLVDAALFAELECPDGTSEAALGLDCVEKVERLQRKAAEVEARISDPSCPLLLPPVNFGAGAVRNLLARINACSPTGKEVTAFRRDNFDRAFRAFRNERGILFSAAKPEARHGREGGHASIGAALRATYRLGCAYTQDYHWDCTIKTEGGLAGKMAFKCSVKGKIWPKGRHTNTWPDDFVTPI